MISPNSQVIQYISYIFSQIERVDLEDVSEFRLVTSIGPSARVLGDPRHRDQVESLSFHHQSDEGTHFMDRFLFLVNIFNVFEYCESDLWPLNFD